ncbi:MAG: 2-oxo acid dehydrogenase subunit E2 [Firmicutes bacterium]|nr:2-oxo acid dehydrogenase subunit E2 [Bacillota bacterium]
MRNRRDGKIIKDINGMFQLMLDLKPKRCDSDVFINQKMDVTKLVEYVEKKKKDGKDITYFHTFLTAIGKTFYNRPKLNRFIANRHVYEHNDITISFVAKVSFDDRSEEIMVMIPIDEKDNINTISKKVKDKVDSIRNKKAVKEGANSAIDVVGKLPNIIRVPLMGLFKWMDKKDLLPKSLIKDNLYYSSIIVSNLGAIKCGAIYHNLTDFGTCSSLATMGEIKKEEIINSKGKKEIRSICEFGINLDERIADGYYFAKSVQLLQYIFDNPELLEEDVSSKIKVNEIR